MRTTIAVLFVMSLSASSSFGAIQSVVVSPFPVLPGQPFTVRVSGEFGDSCWTVTDSICGDPADQEIIIDIDTYSDLGRGATRCNQWIVPYTVTCTYTIDGGGAIWYVRAREHADFLTGTWDQEVLQGFVLLGGTDTASVSWSTAKGIYR